MTAIKALFAGLAGVSLCIAQSVNISGKVTDTSGTALSGAVVNLEKGGQTTTSAADGSFLLTGIANVIRQNNQPLPQKFSAAICNGVLHMKVMEKSVVIITIYNLQGQAVSTVQRTMEIGTHHLLLPRRGAGVYLYKVRSGRDEILIKSNSIGGVFGRTAESVKDSWSNVLSKQVRSNAAINDVIAVTKSGYLNYRVIVTNSDTSGIEIKMIVCEGTVTDIEGNIYQTVKIGNQVWTVENLRTTKFNDGTSIPHAIPLSEWAHLTTPGYCFYGNTTNPDSIKKFGALYNWYVVNTGKLTPAGWHVPTSAEWDTMQNFLIAKGYNWDRTTTDNKIAQSLAAKADWGVSTVPGTVGNDLTKNNQTGFSALPGGSRYHDVDCNYIGQIGYWWTPTAPDSFHAYYRMLNSYNEFLDSYESLNSCGFSIRLVRNNSTITLNDMHVTSPASGWVESQGMYQGIADSTVFSLLYDSIYIRYHPVVNGFSTIYENAAETTTVKAIVLDYGTAANAAVVWDTIKADRATRNHMVDVPGFTTHAIGSQMYHELYIFGSFDKFYIELDLKTYVSDSAAMSDACKFLTEYKSITGVP